MSSMSAYFATVFRLTWSIRAISDLERPAASIDRISFTVSRGTVISSILPGRARQSNRPGKPYGEGRAPGPRGAALLLKLLNFSCSRCLFPSDHSDHFLVNINITRHLASLGMPVREALSPARMQRRRPGQGKCDEADAERAARAAMSGSRLGTPKSQDGWVDGVRCMLAARSGAVKARTSAINTARSLLTTAPEGLRSRFRGMGGPRLMEELPSVRAEGALGAALGALADLWAAARDAALDMERAIEASLEENCPALLAMYGCGPVSAAKLAVAAGDNPGRLRSEASFAAICGACPIPASSGKTVRHRLNRGGDRQANSALHEIARQRVMRDPETAEYAERARGRGKSDREVMRCLKRYVAREAYRALMRPHEIRRPEDASELVAARRAAKVSQVRAASILGTSEKYISMLERGQRELKPIRRAYEAWVEAGLPLDWDRQAFEAERKMDSKKHLAK